MERFLPGAQRFGSLCFVLLFLIFAPAWLFPGAEAETEKTFTLAAVQFAAAEEIYRSGDTFRAAVEAALDRVEAVAPSTAPDRPVSLVVFPEYTSAFLGLAYLNDEEISRLSEDPAGNRDLITRAISDAEGEIIRIWQDISRSRNYAILAGTTLVLDSTGGIRNRALLFSNNGEMIWTQDKVFPGAPERTLLQLRTGRIEADLWIDIKANELPFTRSYYDEALPDRLPDSPIDRGLTVSLSGTMLGIKFSGPTEYLDDNGVLQATNPYEQNAVLIVSVP